MGRHRRSAAGRAATGRAAHAATTPPDSHPAGEPSAGTMGTSGTSGTSYDIVYRAEGHRRAASHRRGRRTAKPVRTGLLGVSAAVAMGAVAVASGLVPGGGSYSLGGDDPGAIRSASSPSGLDVQGDDGSAERGEATPSRGSGRIDAPTPSKSAAEPSSKPSDRAPSAPSKPKPPAESAADDSGAHDSGDARDKGGDGKKETGGDKGKGGDKARQTPAPEPTRTEKPKPKPPPVARTPVSGETAAEAEVLTLVNEERAKAGCRPVRADTALADLAGAFSADMATRDFFAHTDPDGATPWDRAEKAGIADLGGENIARGQVDARSVMAAWMDSPGHRANILNCDYKTMGVGAHFAPGGPWWTQDFGF
ncbi:CAP domain-containing protein [Streptomyces aureocirculatus]|uniref:CAP domain-containing protein n=1 Tax=Streptomyces aureocirculatus TaxID=67275 RepID=UPI0004C5591F|nr:CAP domain-containing protein [Streptomyces aureocirculatus]